MNNLIIANNLNIATALILTPTEYLLYLRHVSRICTGLSMIVHDVAAAMESKSEELPTGFAAAKNKFFELLSRNVMDNCVWLSGTEFSCCDEIDAFNKSVTAADNRVAVLNLQLVTINNSAAVRCAIKNIQQKPNMNSWYKREEDKARRFNNLRLMAEEIMIAQKGMHSSKIAFENAHNEFFGYLHETCRKYPHEFHRRDGPHENTLDEVFKFAAENTNYEAVFEICIIKHLRAVLNMERIRHTEVLVV